MYDGYTMCLCAISRAFFVSIKSVDSTFRFSLLCFSRAPAHFPFGKVLLYIIYISNSLDHARQEHIHTILN